MKNNKNFSKGFTLIELLVVISIIGVLTALLLSNFVGIRGRAEDSKKKTELGHLRVALRLYYNDFQTYPNNGGGGSLDGCGESGQDSCAIGSAFAAGPDPTIYMKELPEYVEYIQTDNGEGFYAGVVISNVSDSDIADSVAHCGIAGAIANTFYVCSD